MPSLTDQGREFCNKVNDGICDRLGIICDAVFVLDVALDAGVALDATIIDYTIVFDAAVVLDNVVFDVVSIDAAAVFNAAAVFDNVVIDNRIVFIAELSLRSFSSTSVITYDRNTLLRLSKIQYRLNRPTRKVIFKYRIWKQNNK